jgi:N6-adenosine-specific RNA methylase IME4
MTLADNKKSDPEFTRLLGNQLMNAKGFYDWGIKRGLTSPEDVRLAIGKRRELAKALIDAGLSRREAGEALGVSRQQIQRDVSPKVTKTVTKGDAAVVLPLPAKCYGTIVIDPPWDMEKIERQVRQNQRGFDYPTMSEAALVDFPIRSLAGDDCHLFCWTTQKFLPASLRLLDVWEFKYVFLMTWYKPGGFQPHGLPQYNSEFVVYARRGAPKFKDTQSFNTCFQGERREHSRKPDVFYDTVRRVTSDGRIDVFSREKRAGFEQYGNEGNKFEATK